LTQHLRSVDLVGRWGGEEFMVIASGTTLDGAAELAEKLRRAIEQHDFPVVGHKTTSIGIATFRAGDTPASLVTRADLALYSAKNLGRNRVEREPA
ncbi:MAG: GGDEF domain-containing protein, partial [Sphingomonadaceae bacterium]